MVAGHNSAAQTLHTLLSSNTKYGLLWRQINWVNIFKEIHMKTFNEWLQQNEVAGYNFQEWSDVIMETLRSMMSMPDLGKQARVILYFFNNNPDMKNKLKQVANEIIQEMDGESVERLSGSEADQIEFTSKVVKRLMLDNSVKNAFNELFIQFKTGERLGKKTFGQRLASRLGDMSGRFLGGLRKAGDATASVLDKGVDAAASVGRSVVSNYKSTMDFMNDFGVKIDDLIAKADAKGHEFEGKLNSGVKSGFAGVMQGLAGSPSNRRQETNPYQTRPVASYVARG